MNKDTVVINKSGEPPNEMVNIVKLSSRDYASDVCEVRDRIHGYPLLSTPCRSLHTLDRPLGWNQKKVSIIITATIIHKLIVYIAV